MWKRRNDAMEKRAAEPSVAIGTSVSSACRRYRFGDCGRLRSGVKPPNSMMLHAIETKTEGKDNETEDYGDYARGG